MRRRFKTAVLLLMMVSTAPAMAQTMTEGLSRHINSLILSTLDDYERTCILSDDKEKKDFVRLFANPNEDCIFNDMLGSPKFQKNISPVEYSSFVPSDFSTILKSEISGIRKNGDFYFEAGKWHRLISFKKYLMIIDSSVYTEGAGGVLFDSSLQFADAPDFNLVADFVYDADKDKCFIAKITPEEFKAATPLNHDKFTVVLNSDAKYAGQLESRGTSLIFNDFDQALAYHNDISINDDDIDIKINEVASGDNYNVVGLGFKHRQFRFKMRYSFTPKSAYSITGYTQFNKSLSKATEIGGDIGIAFPINKNWRMGLYTGAALSQSSINLATGSMNYSYELIDHHHQRYQRSYSLSLSEEDFAFTDVMFPLYYENEFGIGRFLVLSIDLGVKYYMHLKTELSPFHVTGSVSGLYSGKTDSDNQEEAFGPFDKQYTAFVSPKVYSRKTLDLSAYAGASLDIRIIPKMLYGVLSVGYEQGVSDVFSSDNKSYFSSTGNIYPIVYSFSDNQNYAVKSFVGCISYKRQSLWLSIGAKLKF